MWMAMHVDSITTQLDDLILVFTYAFLSFYVFKFMYLKLFSYTDTSILLHASIMGKVIAAIKSIWAASTFKAGI